MNSRSNTRVVESRAVDGQSGFTLLEIMMAVAVLVIGILGVMALFPVAIRSAKSSIETTNAVIIAQSVEQAIREGIRSRRYQTGRDSSDSFFILQHAGVTPFTGGKPATDADYYILLPDNLTDARQPVPRDVEYRSSKVFAYPETDGRVWSVEGVEYVDDEGDSRPNGGGSAKAADNDGDDYVLSFHNSESGQDEEVETVEIRKTYSLGEDFFLDEDDDERAFTSVFDAADPIEDYSFAFTIRRAINDSSLGRELPEDPRFIPANELYDVEVRVYRGFVAETQAAFEPIYRMQFKVSK